MRLTVREHDDKVRRQLERAMKDEKEFLASQLRLASLEETWEHIEYLLNLSNNGVVGAREVAQLTMDRYFDRL